MSERDHIDAQLEAALRLDDRTGPARRISRERAHAIVEAALSAAPAAAGTSAGWRQSLSLRAAAAVLAIGVITTGASAAIWYAEKRTVEPQAPRAEKAAPAPQRHAGTRAPQQPAAEATEPLALPPDSSEEAQPLSPAPQDQLQRANRLRAEGRYRAAADVYLGVVERFPESLSAYAARIAAASLMREYLHEPQRASDLYQSGLRSQPHGALELEALQGLALSYQDLADRQAERTTLQELVRAHPGSPAARRARARLRELQARAR